MRARSPSGPLAATLAAAVLLLAGCGGPAPSGGTGSPGPSGSGGPGASGASPGSSGPATSEGPTGPPLVGIALPDDGTERWPADGDRMVRALQGLGYRTDLRFAADAAAQASQIDELVAGRAAVLVIGAVDPTRLAEPLERAGEAGANVIAYDRLILDSPDVDDFVGFDAFRVGVLQATSIERSLQLKGASGPPAIELFAGAPDDRVARSVFDGAMSVLGPYLETDLAKVPSGEVEFPGRLAIDGWSPEAAGRRMGELLSARDAGDRLDAVLVPADAMSRAVIDALRRAGYYASARPGPIVTGGGAELASVRSILAGEQSSTVFMDNRALADQAAAIADQLIRRVTVDVNDATSVSNGRRIVPSFLMDATLVTRETVTVELVETGYYTAEEVRAGG